MAKSVSVDVNDLKNKIETFATAVRILIIAAQAVSNLVLPDHDAGAFKTLPGESGPLDWIIAPLLSGLTCWDGQYFLHISLYNYTHEQTLAFLPGLPVIVGLLRHLVYNYTLIGYMFSRYTLTIYISAAINLFVFKKAAGVLFLLTYKVFNGNTKLSLLSAILFCINPASIFFSAFYSETLYSFLTFYCMLHSEIQSNVTSSLLASLSGLVRSSGMLNIGYVLYSDLLLILRGVATRHYFQVILTLVTMVMELIIGFIGGASFQAWAYYRFCVSDKHDTTEEMNTLISSHGWLTPTDKDVIPWCAHIIPLSYSSIQSRIWDVGFLQYYQFKQIPNFVLALPVIYIMVYQSCMYLYIQCRGRAVSGMYVGRVMKDTAMLPYVLHALIVILPAILTINIQVLTRLVCCSFPVFYWFCANIVQMNSNIKTDDLVASLGKSPLCTLATIYGVCKKSRPSYCILLYYTAYTVVGTILFTNHYPWT